MRLWTSAAQIQMAAQEVPEIRRMELSPVLLQLLEWGVSDILRTVRINSAGTVLDPGGGVLLPITIGGNVNTAYDPLLLPRTGGGVQLAVGPELSAMYLTYSSGPSWYLFGGVALTGQVRLW